MIARHSESWKQTFGKAMRETGRASFCFSPTATPRHLRSHFASVGEEDYLVAGSGDHWDNKTRSDSATKTRPPTTRMAPVKPQSPLIIFKRATKGMRGGNRIGWPR